MTGTVVPYTLARLKENEGVEKQAEEVNVEAAEVNIQKGNVENVESVEDREAVPDITEEERKALNERRMMRRHERQAPYGPLRSRQQPGEIHSRKKMMSKDKVIAIESEYDRPRKKANHSQEGLDKDILNLLSEAAKREINFLKKQIMAFKDREDGREREITELV
ncbi:hypothetical protein L1987_57369 [Smallanthus sonchifolius]|uniref:Uncharacterized protein n=1 Tax=Smallanthus sonchifolius TaxID=185202 RepID=A0ACB9DCI7_9ASTR|nr:hypothetical protein L1987_57369 [Smallanthus sonchifolius]